jgi:hypothetical protein
MMDRLISSASKISLALIVIFTVVILIAKGFTLVTIEKVLQRIQK